ncbi:MAG: hypothetical protein ACR2GH_01775 [Pseudonocardia sp.]
MPGRLAGAPVTVLILAQDADAPTDAVVAELTSRGVPVFRADTSWFSPAG